MIKLLRRLWYWFLGERFGYEILFNPKEIRLKRLK